MAEVVRAICSHFFGEQDNVGFVDRAKVSGKVMKTMKGGEEVVLDNVPIALEEGRAKAIWTRTCVVIHREEGGANLIKGEGVD
jgi:hypothetical protein